MAQLDAVSFGVPQRRRRLFLVGINSAKYPWLQYHFPEAETTRPKTVREAISTLPTPTFYSRVLKPSDIPFHRNHWTMQPVSKRFKRPKGAKGAKNSDGRSFWRLHWNKPSRTVAYGNREIHIHPNGRRRLTVLEAMLLQGFRADFAMHGNFSEQVAQVSNAVPPPLAAALARSIRQQLYDPIEQLRSRLLSWFSRHQRQFPWRDTKDPYRVLVAEKLLQQTSANNRVVAAYRTLIRTYPTPNALAHASKSRIERIIRPLGFHYRAKELVRLGQELVRRHAGLVPNDLGTLLKLPGVGDYSARAVLSFAFGEQVAVVDTNVARFLTRYLGLPEKKLANPARDRRMHAVAQALVPKKQAREFNLAIVDLSGAYCRATQPMCQPCPLAAECRYAKVRGSATRA
jgi:endonuclease III